MPLVMAAMMTVPMLHHSHEPHGTAVASCLAGGHEMWWVVGAGSPDDALAQLPHFVATRSTAAPITEVQIP
jgi:hypothetical protein